MLPLPYYCSILCASHVHMHVGETCMYFYVYLNEKALIKRTFGQSFPRTSRYVPTYSRRRFSLPNYISQAPCNETETISPNGCVHRSLPRMKPRAHPCLALACCAVTRAALEIRSPGVTSRVSSPSSMSTWRASSPPTREPRWSATSPTPWTTSDARRRRLTSRTASGKNSRPSQYDDDSLD